MVSYRPELLTAVYDVTHTRNVSQGGMLLTVASPFATGTRMVLQARLSLRGSPTLMQAMAEVIEFRELVQNLLYETRVRFLGLEGRSSQVI